MSGQSVVLGGLAAAALAWWAWSRRAAGERDAPRPAPPRADAPRVDRPPPEIVAASQPFSLDWPVKTRATATREVLVRADEPAATVDLAAQTCSCDDFRQHRAGRAPDHFARWCKHLVVGLREDGAFAGADEWIAAIAHNDHGGPVGAFKVALKSAPEVLMVVDPASDWVNVYARTLNSGERIAQASGPIEKFGWSVSQHRWSWGEGPPGARELRRMLRAVEGFYVK